jgi:putative transposase
MRRNILSVYLHFVWATWDRHPFIMPEIERNLYRSIKAICRANGCDVIAIGGTADHVHLLVTFPNTLTFAVMRRVKSGSSKYANEELVEQGSFRWQGNYGVYSVSPSHKKRLIEYIVNQKQHHAAGVLLPSIEEAFTLEEVTDAQVSALADTRRIAPASEGLQPLDTIGTV